LDALELFESSSSFGVRVGVGVRVGLEVSVAVGVSVGVPVMVQVGVIVGEVEAVVEGVAVSVGAEVGVDVDVRLGVAVGTVGVGVARNRNPGRADPTHQSTANIRINSPTPAQTCQPGRRSAAGRGRCRRETLVGVPALGMPA